MLSVTSHVLRVRPRGDDPFAVAIITVQGDDGTEVLQYQIPGGLVRAVHSHLGQLLKVYAEEFPEEITPLTEIVKGES